MFSLANLKFRTKLGLLVAVFVIGFAGFGVFSFSTMGEISVNGPVYNGIVQDKDLLADILPPPKYIVDPYLALYHMQEANRTQLEELIGRFNTMKSEYNDRQQVWLEELADGRMRTLMVRTSYEPATRFFDLVEREYIPLVRAGNIEQAREMTAGILRTTFDEHRKAIDELVTLSIQAAQDKEAAAAVTISNANSLMMAIAVIVLAMLVVVSMFIARSITQPVQESVSLLSTVAQGDLTIEVTAASLKRTDEIGDLSRALNRMKENLAQMIGSVANTSTNVANSAEEMSAVSSQMSSGAEETSNQANVVSAAAEQVNKNLQSVSTGAEEMMASIKEIAKNSNEAASVAATAVKVAENTNATIAKLGDSSVEIGQVIKVITSIAQQTNLLALNATIEAARAGEAGKGFAVVANEVKELAKETAKATEEISQKIEAIQGDSKESVDAIAQITTIIAQINDISNTIAASVEEQTATSTEMGRNVGEAARGSAEIADNISGVAKAAQETSNGANNTLTATGELATMAGNLQQIVNQFKIEEGANGNARPSSRGFQQGAGRQNSLLGVNADAGSSSEAAARRQEHEESVHAR